MKKVLRNTVLTLSLGLVAIMPMANQAKAQDLFDLVEGTIVGGIVGGVIGGNQGAKTGAAIGAIGGLIDGANRDYYFD